MVEIFINRYGEKELDKLIRVILNDYYDSCDDKLCDDEACQLRRAFKQYLRFCIINKTQ